MACQWTSKAVILLQQHAKAMGISDITAVWKFMKRNKACTWVIALPYSDGQWGKLGDGEIYSSPYNEL